MSIAAATNEIVKYRALAAALVRRHVATRYRGSLLGFFWSFLNPLCLMAVYTLVFRYYMRFDGGPNYHLMVFAGLLPWIWTTSALSEGTASIVSSGHLITKSMFPPQVLPLVSVLSTLFNFVLALPVFCVFAFVAGVPITLTWLALPGLVVIHGALLFGLSLACASLNVFFRDVQHLVGNILTFLFFLCPVVYPVSAVPERFKPLIDLNPFASLTALYQGILVRGELPDAEHLVYLSLVAALSLVIGGIMLERLREQFAEVL